MHDIEPHWAWRTEYIAEEDERSPFYGRKYSEFEFTHKVYNYLIHPQWDAFGSRTLYLKIIFVDYDAGYCVIEFIGEWNDCLYNDIMFLKRNVIEILINEGIRKFILLGENVLNFHASDDCYYQEWFEDIEDGWIVAINFRDHVLNDFKKAHLNYYITVNDALNQINWRTFSPLHLFEIVENFISKRLNP